MGIVSKALGKNTEAPPTPNYAKAAEQTALSQMTSQFTPYGSQVYRKDKSSPSGFKSTIKLSPDAQGTLDTQMDLSRGLANTASGQLPAIQDFYSRPLDYQSLSQPAYDAMTSRLNPEWQQREGMERNRLINQGLQEGSEAYQNAMREFGESRNDAYQQATLSSLQNAQQFYGQPLNIFNALRTGAQVQNPQFGGTPGTNYAGAAQNQHQGAMQGYGIEQAGNNNFMSGLFGLGAAAIPGLFK